MLTFCPGPSTGGFTNDGQLSISFQNGALNIRNRLVTKRLPDGLLKIAAGDQRVAHGHPIYLSVMDQVDFPLRHQNLKP